MNEISTEFVKSLKKSEVFRGIVRSMFSRLDYKDKVYYLTNSDFIDSNFIESFVNNVTLKLLLLSREDIMAAYNGWQFRYLFKREGNLYSEDTLFKHFDYIHNSLTDSDVAGNNFNQLKRLVYISLINIDSNTSNSLIGDIMSKKSFSDFIIQKSKSLNRLSAVDF